MLGAAVAEQVLGPAIFKTDESTQHVPDHWRRQLLDSIDRGTLACTSNSGLRLLLEERDQATLTLNISASSTERPEVLSRRLKAAREQLLQRGDKRTTLHLRQSGAYPRKERWWDVVFPALSTGMFLGTLPIHARSTYGCNRPHIGRRC